MVCYFYSVSRLLIWYDLSQRREITNSTYFFLRPELPPNTHTHVPRTHLSPSPSTPSGGAPPPTSWRDSAHDSVQTLAFQRTGPPQPPPPPPPIEAPLRGFFFREAEGRGATAEAFVARLLSLWSSQVASDLTPNRRRTGGQRGHHRKEGQKKEVENLVGRNDGNGGGGVGGETKCSEIGQPVSHFSC